MPAVPPVPVQLRPRALGNQVPQGRAIIVSTATRRRAAQTISAPSAGSRQSSRRSGGGSRQGTSIRLAEWDSQRPEGARSGGEIACAARRCPTRVRRRQGVGTGGVGRDSARSTRSSDCRCGRAATVPGNAFAISARNPIARQCGCSRHTCQRRQNDSWPTSASMSTGGSSRRLARLRANVGAACDHGTASGT
jgi:hypothetical protein